MSPNELDLRATLQDDAGRIDATGDFATAAIARSRRTTRTRATVGAVAAAAAVSVAVPMLWSAPGRNSNQVPASSATVTSSTASPSATATEPRPAETTQPGPAPTYNSNSAKPSATATVRFGPVTGAPTVAYAADGVFHDGARTVPLPVDSGIQVVARLMGGGVLVYAPAEGRAEPLILVDASGSVVARRADVQSVAVSEDGSRIAVADMAGTVRLLDSQGAELAALDTKDPNVSPSAIVGETVYVTLVDSKGRTTTRLWDTATDALGAQSINGRVLAVHAGRSLALVLPNQDYNTDTTCHRIFDLKTWATLYASCGMFAPSGFTPDGRYVVGPEVADGAGASSWKVADVDSARIVLKVSGGDGSWAPTWRAGPGSLVVSLLNGDAPTKQALASCSVTQATCTIDTAPVTVTASQRDLMNWPVVLSSN